MKTLLLINSKYGATKKCAEYVMDELRTESDVMNFNDGVIVDLDSYDTVILGSSIYAGNISTNYKEYLKEIETTLLRKKLYIFVCCKEDHKFEEYLSMNFSEDIINNSQINVYGGYEIYLEKMNFLLRFMMKKLFKVRNSESHINKQNLRKLIKNING